MKLPDELTAEQHAALVACLKRFAEHGRAIRLAREQAEGEQKAKSADSVGPDDHTPAHAATTAG
jgi:hypothetical protein